VAEGAPAEGAVAADGNAEAAGTSAEKPAEQHRRRRRGPPGEFRRDRREGGERGEQRQGEQRSEHRAEHRPDRHGDRSERPRGDRPERSRGERPHFAKDRNEQKDRRDYAPRREREKQPDPDSPFAKLAALKAQLEADAKERR
jgi:ATP-dependent RNA helicase SUPV3L1/SUV3